MRRSDFLTACSALLLAGALSFRSPATVYGQDEATQDATPARVATKLDEYGNLRHCDLTARLDNFAVTLQNSPGATGYIIGYDTLKKSVKRSHVAWQVKASRHYLTNERGLEAARVVVVNGGQRDIEDALTELWIVPEGATPPVAAGMDKNESQEFSGQFDVYTTDENIYRETVEMGWTDSEIAHSQFAEKLKQQPESVGYLVIHPSKNSLKGAWRRIARRDEDILQRDYKVETTRLKSINGGASDDESATVELWILPKSAPPPAAGATEKSEKKNESQPRVAVKLNSYDLYGYASREQAEESWVLENLAELLRDNPRASGYFVVREMLEIEVSEGEASANAEQLALSTPQDVATTNAASTEAEGDASEKQDAAVKNSMMEIAEAWKTTLSTKHGIDAHRIIILQGREMWQPQGRVTTWFVPEKATTPDPFARDADEPEDDVAGEDAESVDATEATTTPEESADESAKTSATPTVVPRVER
ncbi:MAG TPA: hypothetical protein VF666_07915 [Pyrinomonadaceae bacterium]|jgi:hypothetical protein